MKGSHVCINEEDHSEDASHFISHGYSHRVIHGHRHGSEYALHTRTHAHESARTVTNETLSLTPRPKQSAKCTCISKVPFETFARISRNQYAKMYTNKHRLYISYNSHSNVDEEKSQLTVSPFICFLSRTFFCFVIFSHSCSKKGVRFMRKHN